MLFGFSYYVVFAILAGLTWIFRFLLAPTGSKRDLWFSGIIMILVGVQLVVWMIAAFKHFWSVL